MTNNFQRSDSAKALASFPRPDFPRQSAAKIDPALSQATAAPNVPVFAGDSDSVYYAVNLASTSVPDTAFAKQAETTKATFSIYDILIVAIVMIFIFVERLFPNRLFLVNRKDLSSMRKEISQMRGEIAKLTTALGAFLMNVNFRREGDKVIAESKLRDTDTHTMVPAKEFVRLKEMEKSFNEDYVDKLIKKKDARAIDKKEIGEGFNETSD